MGKTKKIEVLFLIALTLVISWVTICPVQAQTDYIGTSSGIFVDNIVEGQPITITVQIYPAPPSGETFSNISVGIVSPLQGISGNGPWDQKNIVTDTNGVAKVTFNIPTFGSAANWNVWLYFGGQYFANNTIYYQSGHWERTFFISPANTPTPTPTPTSTQKPTWIDSTSTPSPTFPMPTINTGPHTEPFPIETVLVVASILTAAVVFSLLLYVRHLKRTMPTPDNSAV